MSDKSINELLAEKGITGAASEYGVKALYRDGVLLGYFRASAAVEMLLPEHRTEQVPA